MDALRSALGLGWGAERPGCIPAQSVGMIGAKKAPLFF